MNRFDMLIIVEGIDKSGKTTFIHDLADVFTKCSIVKNVHKPDGAKDVSIGRIAGIYQGVYMLYNQMIETLPIILDRGHLTEKVYCRLRGYDADDFTDWTKEEEKLKDKAIIFYMSASVETIEKRFKSEKEDYVSTDQIQTILEGYEKAIAECRIPVYRLSSENSREENLQKAIDIVAELQTKVLRYGDSKTSN